VRARLGDQAMRTARVGLVLTAKAVAKNGPTPWRHRSKRAAAAEAKQIVWANVAPLPIITRLTRQQSGLQGTSPIADV